MTVKREKEKKKKKCAEQTNKQSFEYARLAHFNGVCTYVHTPTGQANVYWRVEWPLS